MPTVGLFHTQYWEFSDTSVAPVHIGRGGYPNWQAGVITASLFGAIGAWWDVQYARLKWFVRFLLRLHRLDPERRAMVLLALDTVESPAYHFAQVAVKDTAHTLGFNRPEAWKDLARHMKADNGRTENVFRHLNAMRLVRESMATVNSTLTNQDQNLVTELAYRGYVWRHQ